MRFQVSWGFLCLPIVLAACGATTTTGPTGPVPPDVPVPASYVGIFDTGSTVVSRLGVHTLDSNAITAKLSNGSLDRGADTITITGLTGSLNNGRTSAAINGGGTIGIIDSGQTYTAMYTAQPVGGDPTTGVFGVETHITHLPTGSANFSGSSALTIIDGANFYDLTGTSFASVSFGSTGNVHVTYSSLNGTRTDGVSAPKPVNSVGTLVVSGSTHFGNTFNGGRANWTSNQVSDLSGAQTVTTSGGFFGPNADEIGGVHLIDDTASGALLMLGAFIGQ